MTMNSNNSFVKYYGKKLGATTFIKGLHCTMKSENDLSQRIIATCHW